MVTPLVVAALGLEVVIAMSVLEYADSVAGYSRYTYYNTQIAPLLIPLIQFCLAIVLIGWMLRWHWWPAPRHRQSAHYALACYRESLSWWHVIVGWLILAVALLTVPSVAAVERQRADNIQRGELKTVMSVPLDQIHRWNWLGASQYGWAEPR